jgi:hypothetical protein
MVEGMAEPPVNVRLVMDDGRVVPVDCIYVEQREDDVAVWEVVNAPEGTVVGVEIEAMPKMTSVVVPRIYPPPGPGGKHRAD